MKSKKSISQDPLPSSLYVSFWDVAFYSLMVGLGESYLSAFVLSTGFSDRASGLLVSLPTLIGSVIQLLAGFCVQILGSQRRWVMLCASIQGAALLGLSFIAFGQRLDPLHSKLAIFVLITGYWTFGLAASPSWNSWIGSIVPYPHRTKFFAYRTRIAQLFTVIGLLIAGFTLEIKGSGQLKLPIFSLLFAISAICRYISVAFLYKHPETSLLPSIDPRKLLKQDFWLWVSARRTFIIIIFLFLTQMATNISGPFFNAYMLKQISLDYYHYMALISTAFLARIVAGGLLQNLAHNLGATTLTHLGALLIVPLPALWVLSTSFAYLLFFQALTGFAWGCHELGLTLLYMEKQSNQERAHLLTITQVLNASAMFLGSGIGYILLGSGPTKIESYYKLFILSSCLRLLPLAVISLLGDSRMRLLTLFHRILYFPTGIFRR
ncbi:MAG: MFS transporter [Proteobacteria bacterium]|nr:MFS transporter [Pseudomonadota bacterium]